MSGVGVDRQKSHCSNFSANSEDEWYGTLRVQRKYSRASCVMGIGRIKTCRDIAIKRIRRAASNPNKDKQPLKSKRTSYSC